MPLTKPPTKSNGRDRPRSGWVARVLVGWLLMQLSGAACLAAEVIPPAPANYFNDYAGKVSAATAQQLNRTLEDFEKATSSQVVVAVFPKMQSGSSLEDYSHRVFQAWRVGQQGRNNGAVLFVFVQDRRLRIEVGYGLEGALPDALAKRIIDDEITSRFRNNDFDGGLKAGVTAILQAIRGEYKGTGKTAAQSKGPRLEVILFTVFWIILALIILSRIVQAFRGATVYSATGRRRHPSGWWGGGWSGGGGGGWSSGGGGGGFCGGGGSSGGGGASGSW